VTGGVGSTEPRRSAGGGSAGAGAGSSAWGSVLTLGVEEELMLVDAETLSQRPASSDVIPRVRAERGLVKHELFESIVELNSGVCASPDEALDVLRSLRRATAEAAAEIGCTIAASGSHPVDIASEQKIANEPHYREFVEYAGATARRQGVQGVHVHVGMPDAETCLRVMEHVIPWLPLVLALSANSPWFEGEQTGLLSTRAEILGLLPRHGAPPRFETWSDWERLIRRFCDSGVVDTYTAIHWDVRPHPKYGTLEIRMPDQPTDVARTGAFVQFVHGLAAWALEQSAPSAQSGDRAVYDQNRWAASRFGPRALLIHPDRGGAAASARDLYAELVERTGGDPLDPTVCEADTQLAFADPQDVIEDIVRRSLP
jgi:glutamate---cysteine ligase / carboxylate-amine ligase